MYTALIIMWKIVRDEVLDHKTNSLDNRLGIETVDARPLTLR